MATTLARGSVLQLAPSWPGCFPVVVPEKTAKSFAALNVAAWVNCQQQAVIEYLRTENQVLRETHGKNRIRLNDDQRRRLAAKGKILGRKVLGEIGTIVTPDTILRWHRTLIAKDCAPKIVSSMPLALSRQHVCF